MTTNWKQALAQLAAAYPERMELIYKTHPKHQITWTSSVKTHAAGFNGANCARPHPSELLALTGTNYATA